MYFVYVLRSLRDKEFYTGFATHLDRRLGKHNGGSVRATRKRRPLELVYYEACLNKTDAIKREIYLKTAWGKRYIKNRISKYLKGGPQ